MRGGGPRGPVHSYAHQGPLPPYKKVSHLDIGRNADD